jgi:DNA-binding response OmpR family regulator
MSAKLSTGCEVLVVGCEKALVRYFSVFLKISGYKVDTALSVSEAFLKAQAHPPDILIIMTLMPEISGVEVGLRISSRSHCPVVFVTAMDIGDFNGTLEHLRRQGCACMVLPLPFDNSDLLAKLKALAQVSNQ